MVVGHEYVGEVVGIGQEVKGFKIGDRAPAKVISPAVIATAVAVVLTCVATPLAAWASTVPASRNTDASRRSMRLKSG